MSLHKTIICISSNSRLKSTKTIYSGINSRLLHCKPLSSSDFVRIVEVGPRDGLQNESSIVSVEDKISMITKLADAGCLYIEAGSFVSTKAVPAMASSNEVMKRLAESNWRGKQDPKLVLACLVPTVKYFQNAVDVRVDEVAIFGSASESFSQKVNVNI